MSKLFDNVGKDLKLLASVLAGIIKGIFYVVGILHIILCFVCFGIGISNEDGVLFGCGFAAMVIAVIWIVVGLYLSKLVVMGLYGYGEIVERIISIEQKVTGSGKHADTKPIVKPRIHTAKQATTPWVCPFCEQLNASGTDQCKKCGAEYNCWEE